MCVCIYAYICFLCHVLKMNLTLCLFEQTFIRCEVCFIFNFSLNFFLKCSLNLDSILSPLHTGFYSILFYSLMSNKDVCRPLQHVGGILSCGSVYVRKEAQLFSAQLIYSAPKNRT